MDSSLLKIICTLPIAVWVGYLVWDVFSEVFGKTSDDIGVNMNHITELCVGLDKMSTSTLIYKGTRDTLPSLDDLKLYELGDVITVGDKQYLYVGDAWELLNTNDISDSPQHWKTEVTSKKLQPQVCTCCGGMLDYNSVCMYCGVRYE